MRNRMRKVFALLLATSMMFTMNTVVFAEEATETATEVATETATEVATETATEEATETATEESTEAATEESTEAATEESTEAATEAATETAAEEAVETAEVAEKSEVSVKAAAVKEEKPVGLSADKALSTASENIIDELETLEVSTLKAGSTNLYVVYPQAIAFDGKNKPGSKAAPISDIKVFKAADGKTVSGADLISYDKDGNVKYSASFNEVTVKKVNIKAAKGATVAYEDGHGLYAAKNQTYIKSIVLEDKSLNKELNKVMKENAKKIKNAKAVSSNGFYGTGKDEYIDLMIAVYPAYVGNDDNAVAMAKKIGLETVAVEAVTNKKGDLKSFTGRVDGKKVTLKATKTEGKYKGFDATAVKCDAKTNTKGAEKYYVADGNFCGNIYVK